MYFNTQAVLLAALQATLTTAVALPAAELAADNLGLVHIGDSLAGRQAAPVCNADNVLRGLRDARYSVAASSFCSTYIQKTASRTVTATSTAVVTGTATDTATSTQSNPATLYLKRQVPASVVSRIPPLSGIPASRVSSACSCFITPATLTLTSTTTTPTTATTSVTVTTTAVVTGAPSVTCPSRLGCNYATEFLGAQTEGPASASVEGCRAACSATANCSRFAYGFNVNGGNIVCGLFSGRVSPSTPLFPDAGTGCEANKNYNLDCGSVA